VQQQQQLNTIADDITGLSRIDNINLRHAYFEATGYTPHQSQELIHSSPARFRVAVCGRRFGKSLLAAREVEAIICNPALRNKRIWVVAPTYTLTEKVFREIWSTLIIGGVLHPESISKKSLSDRIIRTVWGSEVLAKSADNPDSLVGDALDMLVMDEAAKMKQVVWEKYLRPTLTDRSGDALFITTPEGGNWVRGLYLRGQDIAHDDWASFSFPSLSNPHLPIADIREAKDTLTAETYQQEYEAAFVTFAGKVYKSFDLSSHVVIGVYTKDSFDYCFAGVDFGYVNPTAVVVIGVRDGMYTVVDELYKPEMQQGEINTECKRLRDKWGIVMFYPDCAEPARIRLMAKAGLPVKSAVKSVTDGIECVAGLFKRVSQGVPFLKVSNKCVHTISEIDGYRYEQRRPGINEKEMPVKDNDHACDALRYALYTRLKASGTVKSIRLKGYM